MDMVLPYICVILENASGYSVDIEQADLNSLHFDLTDKHIENVKVMEVKFNECLLSLSNVLKQ